MDDRVPSISRTPRSTESTHGSPKGARPRRPSKEDLLPKSGEVRLRIASSGPRTLTLTITLSLTLTLTLALTLALTLTLTLTLTLALTLTLTLTPTCVKKVRMKVERVSWYSHRVLMPA